MSSSLAETPLHDWHVQHGGRMVDFAGWSMPVQYASITEEHLATRRHAALFDVSHMGRFRFDGSDAATFLDELLTRRVLDLTPGRIRYALVTRDDGGILDDVLVYHLIDHDEKPFHWLVVNASNRQKILDWIEMHQTNLDVTCSDQTEHTAMIAVQGPQALNIAQRAVDHVELRKLKYYRGQVTRQEGAPWIVSRTGYTGEDGVELIVPAEVAPTVWSRLMEFGQSQSIAAAGLGARDTLRLEAAMPLYGHELTEQINPIQAGLDFAVDLEQRDFPGAAQIREQLGEPHPVRLGLKLAGKRVPRQHYPLLDNGGSQIGEVTSGTFSPTLDCPIAMAYVDPQFAQSDRSISIDIRGRAEPAQKVPLPFYKRS